MGDDADVDFYADLELARGASVAEVRRSYKRLSLRYHPDRSGDANAERFHRIKRAHDVLIDQSLRGIYDRHGARGVANYEKHGSVTGDQAFMPSAARRASGNGGAGFQCWFSGTSTFVWGSGDPLGSVFSGTAYTPYTPPPPPTSTPTTDARDHSGNEHAARPRGGPPPPPLPPLQHHVRVTLEQLARTPQLQLRVPIRIDERTVARQLTLTVRAWRDVVARRYTLRGSGHERSGDVARGVPAQRGTLVMHVSLVKHHAYAPLGDVDLLHVRRIAWHEALVGRASFTLPPLRADAPPHVVPGSVGWTRPGLALRVAEHAGGVRFGNGAVGSVFVLFDVDAPPPPRAPSRAAHARDVAQALVEQYGAPAASDGGDEQPNAATPIVHVAPADARVQSALDAALGRRHADASASAQ